MNLTEEKIKEINKEYLTIRGTKYLTETDKVGVHKLNVADGFDTSILPAIGRYATSTTSRA